MDKDLSRSIQVCNPPAAPYLSSLFALVQSFGYPYSLHTYLFPASCILTFPCYSTANQVRRQLNGRVFAGNRLYVRLFTVQELPHTGNVFVKNLPVSVSIAEVEDLCPEDSVVVSSRLGTDSTGQSLGYGYLQFLTQDMAVAAISKLNQVNIKHRYLSAEQFVRKEERNRQGGHVVFLVNCSLQPKQVKRVFEAYGEVVQVDTQLRETGAVLCVTMGSREGAVAAVRELDGQPWTCSLRPYPL